MAFDASGTYASGGSCPGCGNAMAPNEVLHQTTRSGPSSGAPPLSAGGWGGRPRYRIGSGIGEILEGTFRVWGQTLLPNGLLQCIPMALSVPITVAVIFATAVFGELLDSPIVMISGVVTMMMIVMIAHGASYLGSFTLLDDTMRQQGEENPISAFGTGVRRMPALVGLSILAFFAYLIAGIAPAAALSAASEMMGLAYSVVFALVLIPVALRLSVVVPAMMIEELGPIEAIVRSLDLTRGNTLTIFVSGLAVGAINMALVLFLFLFSLIPLFGFFASIALTVVFGTLTTAFSFTLFAGFRDAAEDRLHGEV